jgi:hypothetical protein
VGIGLLIAAALSMRPRLMPRAVNQPFLKSIQRGATIQFRKRPFFFLENDLMLFISNNHSL